MFQRDYIIIIRVLIRPFGFLRVFAGVLSWVSLLLSAPMGSGQLGSCFGGQIPARVNVELHLHLALGVAELLQAPSLGSA